MEESRICLCDSFWMRNLYTAHFTQDPLLLDDNCDWSLLYVILALLAALSASLLCCVCLCYRLSRRKGATSSHWGGKTSYRNGSGGRAGYKYKTMASQHSKSRSGGDGLLRMSTFHSGGGGGDSSEEEERSSGGELGWSQDEECVFDKTKLIANGNKGTRA
ncbi:hypothetical protein WDU94_000517 [Cyamophila willieti]